MRNLVWVLSLVACSKGAAQVARTPEQDLVNQLALAVTAEPRKAVDLYDLELRQKLDLYEEVTRAPGADRVKILDDSMPRIGDAAALETLRAEVQSELYKGDFAKGLIRGNCSFGFPTTHDNDIYAAHELPEPKPEMGPKIGMFVFQLHKDIGYITKGRVTCPGGATAWIQMVKRKGKRPLKILRIAL